MNLPSDDSSIRKALDTEADALDSETVAALDAARLAAVAAFDEQAGQGASGGETAEHRQTQALRPLWITSVAAAVLAAVVLIPKHHFTQPDEFLMTEADLALIESAESLEMLEQDLEFYEWLALQDI